MDRRQVPGGEDFSVEGFGQVDNVRRRWLIHEDEALATHLQDREFMLKYNRNCAERQQARQDVPLARVVQQTEQQYSQLQQAKLIEQQKVITERDAVIAEQLQSAELINKEQERIEREQRDQELAHKLQHKERLRYELRKKEKELRKQRKQLEKELQLEAAGILQECKAGQRCDVAVGSRIQSNEEIQDQGGFYLQPTSHMSPEQRQRLQQQQDEELARLLQNQERHRGGGRDAVNRDRLREIEQRDAELAQLLAEEEKLRRRRHRERSARHERQTSDVGPSTPAESHGGSSHRMACSLPPSLSDGALRCRSSNADIIGSNFSPVLTDCSEDSSYGHSNWQGLKYSSRPLPATPQSSDTVGVGGSYPYNSSLARALDHEDGQSFQVTAEVLHSAGSSGSRTSVQTPISEVSEPDDGVRDEVCLVRSKNCNIDPGENLFAAIDPTCNRDRGYDASIHLQSSSKDTQPSIPHSEVSSDINVARRRAPLVVEDNYCDLDEIQNSLGGLSVVAGQRRSAIGRDNQPGSSRNNSNCKQQ